MFISPGERRLRAGWRILILGLLLLAGIILVAPIYLITAIINLNPAGILLLEAVISALPITAVVFINRRWIDHRSIKSLGLRKFAWRDLLNGLWISALMFSLIFLVEWVFGLVQFEGIGISRQPGQGNFLDLAVIFTAFFFVGWSEELLFRGYLLVNLRDGLNLFWAVILSSLAFAVMHTFNPNVTWESIVGLAISGVFFAYCALWSKGLWLPIGLHIGWNFTQGAVFGLPVSGIDTISLIKINETGPDIFTGGSFGPEAGLVLLPGLAVGFLIVKTIYSKKSQNT